MLQYFVYSPQMSIFDGFKTRDRNLFFITVRLVPKNMQHFTWSGKCNVSLGFPGSGVRLERSGTYYLATSIFSWSLHFIKITYSQKSNLVTCPIFHFSAKCNQIPKCNLNFDLRNEVFFSDKFYKSTGFFVFYRYNCLWE